MKRLQTQLFSNCATFLHFLTSHFPLGYTKNVLANTEYLASKIFLFHLKKIIPRAAMNYSVLFKHVWNVLKKGMAAVDTV